MEVADVPEPYGEWRVTAWWDDLSGPHLRIDRADPRVLVTRELVEQIRDGTLRNDVRWASLEGDVLRIAAENRTVIYRLGEYLPGHDCYVAEWPD